MWVAGVTGRLHHSYRRKAGTLMIALLALCALVYNGLVLAGHWHAPHRPVAFSVPLNHAVASQPDATCELCDAVAAQEPFLPSTQATTASLPPAMSIASVDRPSYPVLTSRAHVWHSRAPPEPVSIL